MTNVQTEAAAALTTYWHNAVADTLAQLQALNVSSGPVAITLGTSIANWTPTGTYAEAQVSRFGPLVIMAGLIKYTGAGTMANGYTLGTVPSGYRPHAAVSAPIGGKVLTQQLCTYTGAPVVNATPCRIDVLTDGTISLLNVNGSGTAAITGTNWMTLSAWWIGE